MKTTLLSRFTLLPAFAAALLLMAAPLAHAQGLLDSLKNKKAAPAIDSPIDPDVEMTLLLVPWPCPSMEMYKVAEVNMDGFLALMALNDATPDKFQCIIVQSPYASQENVDTIDSDEWWGPTIQETRKRYSFYEELGFVKVIKVLSPAFMDSIGMEYTPSYFIFQNGKLSSSGNIVDLFEDFAGS